MSIQIRLLQLCLTPSVKKKRLRELFEFTAYAFQREVPDTSTLSYIDCLRAYARFTKNEAEKAIINGDDLGLVRARLRENALLLGRKLRERFRITTIKQAFVMARILYRVLKIDFEGTSKGEITVRRCFFATHYSKGICEIISSLDEGLLAGLSGGGVLTFFERITACSACCKARFVVDAG